MSTVLIVQARMGSTRLPGKVMRQILGKPMLVWQLERLKLAQRVDRLVVATSTDPRDDAIEACCRDMGVACSRGSELDVLDRYHAAAQAHGADRIVRVTGDCPLIDPRVVDQLLDFHRAGGYDYASTDLERSYPIGMDAEVVSMQNLHLAWLEANDAPEREHVTPFFYLRPDRFKLGNLRCERRIPEGSRWTVDTAEDFELVRRILTALQASHPAFSLGDVLRVLEENPGWQDINAGVRQKALGE